jgi:hypothetical protein
MNKKEQAIVDAAIKRLRIIAALRWSDDVLPDVPIPTDSTLSVGWLPCFNRVEVACSSAVFHALGRTDKTNSQQPRKLYSTKLRALRALRYETAMRCAEELERIDTQIEAEAVK